MFEKEAGGVGCQACHGLDAKGLQGPGPNIRGKTAEEVRNALQTAEMMIAVVKNLSLEDIEAVAAYLKWLATQP